MQRTNTFLLLFLTVLLAGGWRPARARPAAFEVTENRATVHFPAAVTFRLNASTDGEVEAVTLVYGTNARTCQSGESRRKMDFTPSRQVSLSWEWDLERSGPLPPGAEVWWEWELTDREGRTWRTPRQSVTVEDPAYSWKRLSRGQITVQWVEGGTAFGRSMLDIASRGLERLTEEMGIAPVSPILITIYPSMGEVQAALIHAAEWTGGVAFPAYNSIIVGITPQETEWAQVVLPHELAHLVVDTLVFNCKGITLPVWLSEGLSVYAEGELSETRRQTLETALEKGLLQPLTALASGFSPYPGEASRAYAHSGAVVGYLVETFGPEKLYALLHCIQEGHKANDALQEIYGLDTYTLDRAWRASWGYPEQLPPRGAGAERPTDTPVPTLSLWSPVSATERPTPTKTPALSPTPSRTVGPRETASPAGAVSTPESGSPPQGRSVPWPAIGAVLLVVLFFVLSIHHFKRS